MTEAVLNLIWVALATGACAAAWRSPRRSRAALICAVMLLFPIISISDDFNSDPTLTDAIALAVTMVLAVLMIALAHVHKVAEPAYLFAFRTPSDPRSPPR